MRVCDLHQRGHAGPTQHEAVAWCAWQLWHPPATATRWRWAARAPWVKAKVQASLDDPRPGIPHDQVMAEIIRYAANVYCPVTATCIEVVDVIYTPA